MQTQTRPRMQRSFKVKHPQPGFWRRRLFSLIMIGGVVMLLFMIGAGTFLFLDTRNTSSHAANVNGDCTLIVPAHPLTAQGLATPYQLTATNPDNGPCHEANPVQAAFVQGAIFDPDTSKITIYNPLVTDRGRRPAINPVVPKLPANAVVALWFGANSATLTLRAANNSLQEGHCVNGVDGEIFGQFSYCNAPNFFAAANKAIAAGQLVPPALGTGKDGLDCPTVRDFSVVDQDQSDNVTTTYLITGRGQTAQMTQANAAKFNDPRTQSNASDNRLLDELLDGALGCTPWMAPDLADPGHNVAALPLNELQAAAHQGDPLALVPAGDPMVKSGNNLNLQKLNAYRVGVNQPPVTSLRMASTVTYCRSLLEVAPKRIQTDAVWTRKNASPDPAAANNLFTFLAQRFNVTWGKNGLNCQALLKQKSPITVRVNGDGVAINASFNFRQKQGNGQRY